MNVKRLLERCKLEGTTGKIASNNRANCFIYLLDFREIYTLTREIYTKCAN